MRILIFICCIFALAFPASSLKNDICDLEHSKDGDNEVACRARFLYWSYKAESNECVEFIYGGCGGNENRFNSREECEKMCKK